MIIKYKGICSCKYEPRGEKGLEGYQLKQSYYYEYVVEKKSYYKIYPELSRSNYNENCSKITFNCYFDIENQFDTRQ